MFLSLSEKNPRSQFFGELYGSTVEYLIQLIHWSQAVCVFPQGAEKSLWVPVEEGEQGKSAVKPRRTEPIFQWQQIWGDECDCRTAVFAVLFLLNTSVNAELLWAYKPNDPFVFYFVHWEKNNILVYVNDSEILGVPKASHIVP